MRNMTAYTCHDCGSVRAVTALDIRHAIDFAESEGTLLSATPLALVWENYGRDICPKCTHEECEEDGCRSQELVAGEIRCELHTHAVDALAAALDEIVDCGELEGGQALPSQLYDVCGYHLTDENGTRVAALFNARREDWVRATFVPMTDEECSFLKVDSDA